MLKVFRFILLAICFFSYVILAYPFVLLRPFDPNNNHLLGKFVRKVFLKILGCELIWKNEGALYRKKPVIFLANHQNTLDVIFFGTYTPPKTIFIGKKEIMFIPFFGPFFWLCGHVLINRKDHFKAMKTMKILGKKITNEGLNIFMFPEGTRRYEKGLGPFKKGAFRLAIDTHASIVPIVVSTMHEKINLNRWHSGKVIIKVMPEISVENFTEADTDKLIEYTRHVFIEEQKKLDSHL